MAKDPVCGMYIEEKPSSIKHTTQEGIEYYFCSKNCLDEFTAPEKEMKKLKMHVIIGILLTIPITILTYIGFIAGEILPENINNYILLSLATPVQFWIGWRFYRGLWDSIKAKSANMDALIAIGTSAAYFYSAIVTIFPGIFPFEDVYFETAAIIITLILIGRLLETRTKEKASSAVRKLLDLQPRMAKVIRENEKEVEIPIEQVQQDDIMIIRPGERIPTDGIIIKGFSSIDESVITGESIPVDKAEGQEVIGSTINKSGLLKVKATKVGKDTVLSSIIRMVEEARTGKAPMQKMADQVSKYFVPAVIIIAISAGLGWYFFGGIGLTFSLLAFVSVMIIACPCALGIATPAALMMGSGKAAENGILFKGGEYLEIAKKIKTVVFDKTGTLTKGKPEVTDIIVLENSRSGSGDYDDSGIKQRSNKEEKKSNNITQPELLRLAAVAESGSEHPLGQAIVKKALEDPSIGKGSILNPDSFESVSGHGIKATYGEHSILIGNRKLMIDRNIFTSKEEKDLLDSKLHKLEIEGKTAILVSIDDKISGIIALADTLKDHAKYMVDSLKSMGINVIMLTGDNLNTAKAMASKLGIDRVIADVLPQEKEKVIADLKKEEVDEKKSEKSGKILKIKKSGDITGREGGGRGGKVAMVGDGINDAPALARADLGIAIGSGTDVAKETGGIILIKDDLRDVITALDLGKKTVSKIKQNLFWAFAYNTGLIPVAAGALVPFIGAGMYAWLPFLAAAAMAMSSVTVVGNSLLLGRYKPKGIDKKS
ncbi:MAG: heavy metal translocating P-type ATPase [Nitrososphaeraceae archaeon]